jgi:hypothetical protein
MAVQPKRPIPVTILLNIERDSSDAKAAGEVTFNNVNIGIPMSDHPE